MASRDNNTESNMVIIEIKMQTGWEADQESLDRLVRDSRLPIKRTETDPNGAVQVYVSSVSQIFVFSYVSCTQCRISSLTELSMLYWVQYSAPTIDFQFYLITVYSNSIIEIFCLIYNGIEVLPAIGWILNHFIIYVIN